jgi:hypothetical protein
MKAIPRLCDAFVVINIQMYSIKYNFVKLKLVYFLKFRLNLFGRLTKKYIDNFSNVICDGFYLLTNDVHN